MYYYQTDAFSSTQRQDTSFFDRPENSTGTLASRITSEPYNIVEMLAYNLLYIVVNIVNVIASAILAIAYGWKLGLVLVLGVLPVLIATGYARIRLELKMEEEAANRFAQSSGLAPESVLAIGTVSSLALESTMIGRYQASLQRIAHAAIMGLGWEMFFYALSQSEPFLVMALGFW
jgi:ATP-binding cassette subfamily B (MDR/TAP) protein 1